MKKSTLSIRKLKGERPVVALTAYDALFAKLAEKAGVDIILVGDSVGTTYLGMPDTVGVTLDMIIHHCAAVSRVVSEPLLVADMPFGCAHGSDESVLRSAVALMQRGGAQAVKIEGGVRRAPVIGKLVEAGVPVMGHIGLEPQQFHQLGGYRKFGKEQAECTALLDSAKALEAAGVFAIVAEMVTPDLTAKLCKAVSVPIIAIGCEHPADGQILVSTDLLGLAAGGYIPRFAKQYAKLDHTVGEAFSAYVKDVQSRIFNV